LHLANGEDAYKSLQLLELGRGVLANLQLEVRSDISILAASHPNLAQEFEGIRNEIDSPLETFDHSSVMLNSPVKFDSLSQQDLLKSTAKRRALAKDFENLLTFIRSLDGFGNFLRGPSESEL
jgi:hypothetical protein